MAFNEIQQIQTILEQSTDILVTFRKDASGDALASALAVALFLESQKKHVDIVVDDFVLPKKFSFLTGSEKIQSVLPPLQKFLISLDIQKNGVQELSYDIKGPELRIYITPKTGSLDREQIKTAQTKFRYDLIVTLNTPDLHALGTLADHQSSLFHTLPIINIDSEANNERYGQINLVPITATSTSEAVAELLLKLSETSIDANIATALLTGMIDKTNSFKTKNIRPQTLSLASRLIGMGADREYIIEQLYRTKTLSALKLWGQALSHLEFDEILGLAITTITREDFARTGATEHDLYDMIDEIVVNAPEAKHIVLLHEPRNQEPEDMIHAVIHSNNHADLKNLFAEFDPSGDPRRITFLIPKKNLNEAKQQIKTILQQNN